MSASATEIGHEVCVEVPTRRAARTNIPTKRIYKYSNSPIPASVRGSESRPAALMAEKLDPIVALKTAFLRQQVRVLSQPLRPSERWKNGSNLADEDVGIAVKRGLLDTCPLPSHC
jgi:hypothetical protein